MPTLLKRRTTTSPGIISFTHNEALWGVPAQFPHIRQMLNESVKKGQWLFGVHIQGDCSFLRKWPNAPWNSFFMWPDADALYLSNIEKDAIIPRTCINFLESYTVEPKKERKWDICIVSRPSKIKRINETLDIVRKLMDRKKDLKVVFIVPDPRHLDLGERCYEEQRIEQYFFESPLKLFSSKELLNLSFISSSQDAFGKFPLADEIIADIVADSKFLFLNSHQEGVPRVIGEAFLAGTPCIVSKKLRSGINHLLNTDNTCFVDDAIDAASEQIFTALANYQAYHVDVAFARKYFCAADNELFFREILGNLIRKQGLEVNGEWTLGDLHRRLACHGMKNNYQVMNNDRLFTDWFSRLNNFVQIDDTYLDDLFPFKDSPRFTPRNWRYRTRKSLSQLKLLVVLRKNVLKLLNRTSHN